MRLRPVIISYPDSPIAIGAPQLAAASSLTEDVTRLFNRITAKAMRFDRQPMHLHATFNLDPALKVSGARSTPESWWDAWRVLRANDLSEADDVWLVWHNNNVRDVSGIGMPASPHAYDGDLENDLGIPFEPGTGGIATNGLGQLQNAIAAGFEGDLYMYAMSYAAHEVGHAIGRHHTPDPVTGYPNPNNLENQFNSIMSYGYSLLATGRLMDGRHFNPKLALPEEIITWRRHAVFEDIPERADTHRPGWADDLILTRVDDQNAMIAAADTAAGRRRLLTGGMRSDINDPIE